MRISDVLKNKGSAVATIAPETTVAVLLAGLVRRNIGAMVVVWTPLEVSGGLLDGMLETFGQGKPIGGRPGQPAELASLYVLLASEEPGYSSGQVFGATGGTGGP